jgi:SAM-dependent methyltransferase
VYAGLPDRRHWIGEGFGVVRCTGCGLARTDPRPTPEAISRYYPESYVSFHHDHPRHGRITRAARWLLRLPYRLRYGEVFWLPPASAGGRALDVGSGSGDLLAELQRRGWEPWGIEPDPGQAEESRRRLGLLPHRVLTATAEAAELPAEAYGLVTMAHVLEHVHEPVQVLAKVRSWMRPGGLLRIWVPNIASLESRAFGGLWFGLDMPRHLYHFDRPTLRRLLRTAGFELVRMVPQYQAASLSGSLNHAWSAALRRRRDYRHWSPGYYGCLPVASLLTAAGFAACLDVTARRG